MEKRTTKSSLDAGTGEYTVRPDEMDRAIVGLFLSGSETMAAAELAAKQQRAKKAAEEARHRRRSGSDNTEVDPRVFLFTPDELLPLIAGHIALISHLGAINETVDASLRGAIIGDTDGILSLNEANDTLVQLQQAYDPSFPGTPTE